MQNELEVYLRKLKGMQTELSTAALTRPRGKTSFDYGQVCGRYEGLLLAEQLLTKTIEEVANDDN